MTIKFKETKIKVSFFFALAITLLGIFDKNNTVLLSLCAAALHEAGHLCVMIFFGEMPREIDVTPFGIRIERIESSKIGFGKEVFCALAGPAVNLILALIFRGSYFSKINAAIAAFNMLACEPLDGGKILENILLLKFSREKTEKISLLVSCVTVFPVAIVGFVILIKSRYNFSLLIISFYLIFFIALKKKNI